MSGLGEKSSSSLASQKYANQNGHSVKKLFDQVIHFLKDHNYN